MALVVALLNGTGLGAGYIYIGGWKRWSVHFLITVGLIYAVYLTAPQLMPGPWPIILGVWLLWMVVDGRRQALNSASVRSIS